MRMRLCLLAFQITALVVCAGAHAQSLDRYRTSLPKGTDTATGVDLASAPDQMRPLLTAFLSEDPGVLAWDKLAASASVVRPTTAALLISAGPAQVVAIEIEGLSDGEWLRVEAVLGVDGYQQEKRGRVWSRDGAPGVARLGAGVVAIGDATLVKALQRPRRARGVLAAAALEIPSPAIAWHVQEADGAATRLHVVAGSGLLVDVVVPATSPEAAVAAAEQWRARLAADGVGAEFEPSPAALAILRGAKIKPLGSSVRMVFTASSDETEAALRPLLTLLKASDE